MMRLLGIIPARGGSKRVPRKNVRRLLDKPLVAWTIEAALGSTKLSRVVVSSDDAEVLAVAAGYDPKMALRRPDEMSGDLSPAMEYVRHALDTLEAAGEQRFDGVVVLQPSSPFTTSRDIDATIEVLERSGASSAVSIMAVDHATHPIKFKRLEGDRLLPFLEEERGRMAEHELPKLYVRNCSVYAARRSLVDTGELIGPDCRGYVMPRERSVDINDELDWEFAQFLAGRK